VDDPPQDPDPSAEDHAYFQALEEDLARLRGAALLLAPADWQVAAEWRRRGVPLELVRRTMAELYARRVERGTRRRINSLRYFAPAVEAAWEELRALTGPGHRLLPPPIDAVARLAALAGLLPAELPGRAAWTARIAALAGDTETIESGLAALDGELLAALDEGLGTAERAELAGLEERTVAALTARLPRDEVAAARARLRRQLLRERWRLPVLSLFAPEVTAAAGERAEDAGPV
jgi:hypothetical protein